VTRHGQNDFKVRSGIGFVRVNLKKAIGTAEYAKYAEKKRGTERTND
jgi:hypothetical protein